MTGLVRKAMIFAACSVLLGAGVSFAGTPYPGNCTIQWFNTATSTFVTANRINLVDYNPSAADANNSLDSIPRFAKIWVTVKDISGNPINASNVQLKFDGALSDLKICSTQPYHGEIVSSGVGAASVRNYTNASGQVTFVVGGASTWAAGSPIPAGPTAHPAGAVQVIADTTPLFNIGCGTFDFTRSLGVDLTDLSRWSKDLFSATHDQDRSDYNGALTVELTDLSVMSSALFAIPSHASCAVLVP